MSAPLPTEFQCLAKRLSELATVLVDRLACLPNSAAAATGWHLEQGTITHDAARDAACGLLEAARTLQFDALRLLTLADEQADSGREIFAATMALVDAARMAAARGAATADLACVCEERLSGIQAELAWMYPGEDIPNREG